MTSHPIWTMFEGYHPDKLGIIPAFLDEDDPRPAKEQINDNYQHGGGWNSFKGFRFNTDTYVLTYPHDPPMRPIAMTKLRGEIIIFYPHDWLLILQPDKSWEVARID